MSRSARSVNRYLFIQNSARPCYLLGLGKDFIDAAVTDSAGLGVGHQLPQVVDGQLRFPARTVATDQVADVITGARILTSADLGLDPVLHGIGQRYGHC